MRYYIALDIGATKIGLALCNRERILDKITHRTPRDEQPNSISELIVRLIKEKWSSYLTNVDAIGVATIGPLDIAKGAVVNTPNIPSRSFEIRKPLVEEFKKPTHVVNDCVAAVWGERLYGDAREVDNVVYLTLSTGVGAGVIIDGDLILGKAGNAHEVGHIVVNFNSDLPCGCGGRGHWESYAGGANLPRVAAYIAEKERVKSKLAEKVLSKEHIDAKTIFDYYRVGDALAKKVVELYISATAAGLASVINAYDPELVLLGGGVFLNNVDVLYKPMVSLIKSNVVTKMPAIRPTRFGDDVALYGSLAIATNPPLKLIKIQESFQG
ncbi:MAG: ROK family protein [Desulfurococcaceae archaeon]